MDFLKRILLTWTIKLVKVYTELRYSKVANVLCKTKVFESSIASSTRRVLFDCFYFDPFLFLFFSIYWLAPVYPSPPLTASSSFLRFSLSMQIFTLEQDIKGSRVYHLLISGTVARSRSSKGPCEFFELRRTTNLLVSASLSRVDFMTLNPKESRRDIIISKLYTYSKTSISYPRFLLFRQIIKTSNK